MNFSHGDYDYHQSVIDNTRKMLAGVQNLSYMGQRVNVGFASRSAWAPSCNCPRHCQVCLPVITHTLSFSPQKGPEIRTGNMRNGQDVSLTTFDPFYMMDYGAVQIPIVAGHEFVVATDLKYKDICDDKYMYVDYVSGLHYRPLEEE
jgi:pyruvate kinase